MQRLDISNASLRVLSITHMKLEICRIAESLLPQLACDRRVFGIVLASAKQEHGYLDFVEVLDRLLIQVCVQQLCRHFRWHARICSVEALDFLFLCVGRQSLRRVGVSKESGSWTECTLTSPKWYCTYPIETSRGKRQSDSGTRAELHCIFVAIIASRSSRMGS